ncbi:hypothetical protein AC578_150 [Pseudocercospora eumusae]|uniref:Uncharacterized protein n=1 Tax=Pseudocercospora eumusae TaxID=321146 RepID=A0A139H2P0_9PEZI|nr:hypothetical protein AC578_150 [Pseudocercospora eumusae]
MPGNPFYSVTRKLGRNWDAETQHLIHPQDSSCRIAYENAPNQPIPNPVLPGPWSASVADFKESSPEQSSHHYPNHHFNNPIEGPASREKPSTAKDRSQAEKSKSASYTSPPMTKKPRSQSADSKVQRWLENVETGGCTMT